MWFHPFPISKTIFRSLAVLIGASALPWNVLAQPAGFSMDGTWAVGSSVSCSTKPYVVVVRGNQIEFRDVDGNINVERITNLRPDSFDSETGGSSQTTTRARWTYTAAGRNGFQVQNLTTGKRFVLARCPQAQAGAVEQCLIRVDGKTYVNKPCNVERDADGSLRVNVGADPTIKAFAYIYPDSGSKTADGYWNGGAGFNRAQDPLGILNFINGCWENTRFKICAGMVPKTLSESSSAVSPEAFIRTLYEPYLRGQHRFVMDTYFEPSLARLWNTSARNADEPGHPTTSRDWACFCQDGDMSDFQVSAVQSGSTGSVVTVAFKLDNEPIRMRYDLALESGRWLIKDIYAATFSKSLRRDRMSDVYHH